MAAAGSAASVEERRLGGGHRLEGAGALAHDAVGELGAGGHAELPERLAQVVLHGARADEELGGDVPVRLPAADQGGDLCLLGGELLRRTDLAFPRALAG